MTRKESLDQTPVGIGTPDYFQESRQLIDLAVETGILPPWPPQETPQLENERWWEEEIAVFPHQGIHRFPHVKIIGIEGLFQAGKSSLEAELSKRLRPALTKSQWSLEVWPEEFGGNKHVVWDNFPAVSIANYDDDILLFSDLERRNEIDWYFVFKSQLFKLLFLEQRIYSLLKLAHTRPDQATLALCYRSPIDAIIWYYTLFSHREDPRFTVPDLFREDQLWIPDIAGLFTLSKHIDAVVLMGLSQKEACRRRKSAEKEYSGLTETGIFKTYSAWIGYWIKEIFPKLHQINGAGLLVLNGEAPPEENLERLITYVENVTGRKKKRKTEK